MVESGWNVVRADTFVKINIARVRQTQLRHGVQAVAAQVELRPQFVLVFFLFCFCQARLVNLPQRESVLSVLLPVKQPPGIKEYWIK